MQQAGDKFLEEDKNIPYFHFLSNFNKRKSNTHVIQGPLDIWYDSRAKIVVLVTFLLLLTLLFIKIFCSFFNHVLIMMKI